MTVHVVRLGTPRLPGEGLRLGTVRRPPRGVPKADHARGDWYDVWLPVLSPSAGLVRAALATQRDRTPAGDRAWHAFERAYRREMAQGDAPRVLDLLAALSAQAQFSVGCYCEDASRCHRQVLGELLRERGARMA